MKILFYYILSICVFCTGITSVRANDSVSINNIVNTIDQESEKLDTAQILNEKEINEVKEYIAYMEALLKKNDVGFSKNALAKKSEIDQEIAQKLTDLKTKIKEREEAIENSKTKNILLIGGITGTALFIIPLILALLLRKNNEKAKSKNIELEGNIIEVQRAYSDIKASMGYAKRIQSSVLVKKEILNEYVEDSFVLHQSKEEITSVFYFFAKVNSKMIVATLDCKSSGVAGAFITMMWQSFLNETIKKHEKTNPEEILQIINKRISESLSTNNESIYEDGINMGIVTIDKTIGTLQFAGANQSIVFVGNERVELVKGEKSDIGKLEKGGNVTYQVCEKNIVDFNTFYLFNEGFLNQINIKSDKFGLKEFVGSLETVANKSFLDQKNTLEKEFNFWKTNVVQREDVLLIGVKVD